MTDLEFRGECLRAAVQSIRDKNERERVLALAERLMKLLPSEPALGSHEGGGMSRWL